MYKKIYLLLIVILLVSCKNVIKEYDNDGNLIREYYTVNQKKNGLYKEYDNSGEIKIIHHYEDDKVIDSSLFYENGHIRQIKYWDTLKKGYYFEKILNSEGNLESFGYRLLNGIRVKKWPLLNKDGIKVSETEYFNFNNEEYVNQIFHFNGRDTIFDKGSFYEMIPIKDTVTVGEDFKLYFFLRKSVLGYDSSFKMILPKYRKGFNFNSDFSNINETQRDTVLSLNNYIDDNSFGLNHVTTTMFNFKTPGVKKLRIILNESIDHKGREDNLIKEESIILFEKEIFVKDTIQ